MSPRHVTISVALIVYTTCPVVALAQSFGGGIEVKKSVIAGGSVASGGGNFHVSTTAGQHDAGVSTGGSFTVQGGFWPSSAESSDPGDGGIFRDGFESGADHSERGAF